MQVGLNKGESKNALARAVFFNRLGEIRDRSFEDQRYRASGLNLVVAAIVLWNTVYLERAVNSLRHEGRPEVRIAPANDAPACCGGERRRRVCSSRCSEETSAWLRSVKSCCWRAEANAFGSGAILSERRKPGADGE